jgi:hypothetical protein
MYDAGFPISTHDRQHLRELARKVAAIAASPLNQERRKLWLAHDRGERVRPLVVTETDGGLKLIKPDHQLRCEAPWLHGVEHGLTDAILHFELLKDDRVIEPFVNCNWDVHASSYGVETTFQRGNDLHGGQTGYTWEAPIKDLEADFHKLRPRTFSVNRETTLARHAALEEVFDGVLKVRRRGSYWWTMGLTQTAVYLVGLEEFLIYICEAPEAVHQLMAFLRDDELAYAGWLEQEGLLNLNNENDYIGSGSFGYCADLPQKDWKPGTPVRATDQWVLIESQETSAIGPRQYGEFVFPYHQAMAERFGKVYYGCCEPVDSRWEYLVNLANLKRISISPWAKQEVMAERLAHGRYVYSRKPSPAMISTDSFDEELIRKDLRTTVELAKKHDVIVEISMKDVHTLNNQPHRLPRWVELAREEVERDA